MSKARRCRAASRAESAIRVRRPGQSRRPGGHPGGTPWAGVNGGPTGQWRCGAAGGLADADDAVQGDAPAGGPARPPHHARRGHTGSDTACPVNGGQAGLSGRWWSNGPIVVKRVNNGQLPRSFQTVLASPLRSLHSLLPPGQAPEARPPASRPAEAPPSPPGCGEPGQAAQSRRNRRRRSQSSESDGPSRKSEPGGPGPAHDHRGRAPATWSESVPL